MKILPLDHEILNRPCNKVEKFDDSLASTLDAMASAMTKVSGKGLSANQIGVSLRMFVMEKDGEVMEFINPVFTSQGPKRIRLPEGCLSLPGVFVQNDKRYATVSIRYQDRNGEERKDTFEKLDAVCVQHEMEHLDGINFTSTLNRKEKRRLKIDL